MAKPIVPKSPFRTINGVALLGEGAGTLADGVASDDDGDEGAGVGVGAAAVAAETLITLMSTFCPA